MVNYFVKIYSKTKICILKLLNPETTKKVSSGSSQKSFTQDDPGSSTLVCISVTAHGRRSVHHEDLVPNEYISKLAHFYRNCFTDLSRPMVADFLDTF